MPTADAPTAAEIPDGMRLNRRGKLKKLRKRSILWKLRRLFYLLLLLFVAGCAGVFLVLSQIKLPDANDQLAQTTFVCSSEVTENCGPENDMFKLKGDEDRINITYDQIPEAAIEAVISAEDRDFFEHGGIDPVGIARAMFQNAQEEEIVQGGSTITQQYVKNVYLTRERSLWRKLKEAVLAVKVDDELSKEEILERYLNTIYFGRGAYGIQAASRAYFGHDIQELDGLDANGQYSPIETMQVAYLAALIRSPESTDAQRNPMRAKQRRNSVLRAMYEEHYLTREEFDAAKTIDWEINPYGLGNLVPRSPTDTLGDVGGREYGTEYFAEYVRQWLVAQFGEDAVYRRGLRVYTTLNRDFQQAAYETVTSTLNQQGDPAASIVGIDDRGRVRAMMGGTDFHTHSVNLAVGQEGGGSGRQPGSSFKPFAVVEALEQGYSAEARISVPGSKEFQLPNGGGTWRVSGGGGNYDMINALPASSNMFFATLMLTLGAPNVIDVAHRMGVTADLPEVPSIVLGAGEVSPMDMASAYSTLMNHGVHYGVDDPRRDGNQRTPIVVERVEDSDGNVIYEAPTEGREVISPTIADQATTIMRGVVTRGTGTAAALDTVPVAGKTGTTQNNKDAWFVGFRCNFVTSVWMGYPGFDGAPVTPMSNVHGERQEGGRIPARMWHDFMTRVDPMINDDCELADVSEFAPGKDFDPETLRDLGVGSGGTGTGGGGATCPDGYIPGDLNGDGQIESCVATGGGNNQPPPTNPPPTQPPVTQPPVTTPPTTVLPGPGP